MRARSVRPPRVERGTPPAAPQTPWAQRDEGTDPVGSVPSSTRCRRRSTLPRPLGRSTIDAAGLNGRVRDGNGCGPCALVASGRSDVRLSPADATSTGNGCPVCVPAYGAKCERGCGIAAALVRGCGSVARDAPINAAYRGVPDWGEVKPHGRCGPLRSEPVARRPRAAARRGGLPRPFRGLEVPGMVHLGGGFPLRCFQRLSAPIIATRRCSWRHSRDTSGSSDPVLSY